MKGLTEKQNEKFNQMSTDLYEEKEVLMTGLNKISPQRLLK